MTESPTKRRRQPVAAQIADMQSLGQGAISWLLGVSQLTLRQWHDVPRNADGTYDAKTVVAWYAASGKAGDKRKRGGDVDEELKTARIDLVEAQTDKIRAKLTTEAEAAFSMRCNALVGHLTALANRYRQRDMVDALEMLNVTLDAARE